MYDNIQRVSVSTFEPLAFGIVDLIKDDGAYGFVEDLITGGRYFFFVGEHAEVWPTMGYSEWPLVTKLEYMRHQPSRYPKVGDVLRFKPNDGHIKGPQVDAWVFQEEYMAAIKESARVTRWLAQHGVIPVASVVRTVAD